MPSLWYARAFTYKKIMLNYGVVEVFLLPGKIFLPVRKFLRVLLKNNFLIERWVSFDSLKRTLNKIMYFYYYYLIRLVCVIKFGGLPFTGSKKLVFSFYPELPARNARIYHICLFLGARITDKINKKDVLYFKWCDATYYIPDRPLWSLMQSHSVVNMNCNDISKKNVDRIFFDVFGYSQNVDPTKYSGLCIKKNNLNSRKPVEIILCPVESMDCDYVYQMLLTNVSVDGFVVEMRAPIILNELPFVKLYCRNSDERLTGRCMRREIVRTSNVISDAELEKILKFCRVLGLEYGEIDMIRNDADSLLYILDANNTPSGYLGSVFNDFEYENIVEQCQSFNRQIEFISNKS